jgi:hypothetical protein
MISHMPGLGTHTGQWLSGAFRSESDAIRIAGLRPPESSDSIDCMRGIESQPKHVARLSADPQTVRGFRLGSGGGFS